MLFFTYQSHKISPKGRIEKCFAEKCIQQMQFNYKNGNLILMKNGLFSIA